VVPWRHETDELLGCGITRVMTSTTRSTRWTRRGCPVRCRLGGATGWSTRRRRSTTRSTGRSPSRSLSARSTARSRRKVRPRVDDPAQLVESPRSTGRRGGGHTGTQTAGVGAGRPVSACAWPPAATWAWHLRRPRRTLRRRTCPQPARTRQRHSSYVHSMLHEWPFSPPLRHATAFPSTRPTGGRTQPCSRPRTPGRAARPLWGGKGPLPVGHSSCQAQAVRMVARRAPTGRERSELQGMHVRLPVPLARGRLARGRPVGDAPRRSGMCSRVDPLMRDSPGAVRALRAAAPGSGAFELKPEVGCAQDGAEHKASAAAIAAASPRGRPRPRGVPARPCLDHRVGRLEQ